MKKLTLLSAVTAALSLTGCNMFCCSDAAPEVNAVYAPGIKPDGKMSDPAWSKAAPLKLVTYENFRKLPPKSVKAIESQRYKVDAEAKVLFDDKNIYIGMTMKNDDIHAERNENQVLLSTYGDALDVFLKPSGTNGIIELFANPRRNKASVVYPSRGFGQRALLATQKTIKGLRVYTHVDGTLNNSKDTDKGWSVVMVIPKKSVEQALKAKFDGKTQWSILIAGHSCSINMIQAAKCSYPELPENNFLLTEYYSPLNFVK